MSTARGFASDTIATAHPRVMEWVAAVNTGYAHSYGDDPWTAQARELVKRAFGEQAEAYFVFSGTGANVTALQALMPSWGGVICPETAHLNTDECGAPERFTGGKLLTVPTPDGKLTPSLIAGAYRNVGFEHATQPRVVSITQCTEYGTVYTRDELAAVATTCKALGLKLHIDGARLANAAASLGCTLGEACAGADVVSFGGTKNGAMIAEAVIFLNPALAGEYKYIRKQSAQLSAKTRFIAAQYIALLEDGLWHENAAHANAMARLLAEKVAAIPNVRITQRVEANEVFAILPHHVIEPLEHAWDFHVWDDRTDEVRWVTCWETREEDVLAFAEAIRLAVR